MSAAKAGLDRLAITDIPIVRVERLDTRFAPRPWPFADARRADIDRHFAALKSAQPALWNGRVLLLHDHAVEGTVFRGAYLETDFASFIAWRDWDFPDRTIRNCFSLGALRGSDGGFLLGVMGAHTVNAGKIYFPAGTPDPDDIVGEEVDLAGSVWRELAEETGLVRADLVAEDGWYCVLAGARIALVKILQARETAELLRRRILAHLARERAPELADIRVVRGPADFDPMMLLFVTAFLAYIWSKEAS
jgi:8-oxo-dGTP pyrophosphatase MutT (NUDIX family)